jgi:hypothetical protein
MTDGNHSKPVKLSSGEERVLYASSDKASPQVPSPRHTVFKYSEKHKANV